MAVGPHVINTLFKPNLFWGNQTSFVLGELTTIYFYFSFLKYGYVMVHQTLDKKTFPAVFFFVFFCTV